MRGRAIRTCILSAVVGVTGLWAVQSASGQILPTGDGREINTSLDLFDDDESFSDSVDGFPPADFAPFFSELEFNESLTGCTGLARAAQISAVGGSAIYAEGSYSLYVEGFETGASADACADSTVYVEFDVAAEADYHLTVVNEAAAFGELRTAAFDTIEDLSFTQTVSGTLDAGSYVFEMYLSNCLSAIDQEFDSEDAGFSVSLALDSGTCVESLDYPDFSDPADLAFVGDAAVANGDTVRLTPEATDQAGAVWYAQKVHVANGFDTTFTFRVSPGISDGGDGFAFLIQDESPIALAGSGSDMGYGAGGLPGITRSLAVEFDTVAFGDEFPEDHISVQTDGVNENNVANAFSLDHLTLPNVINDDAVHTCRIVYTPGAPGTLDIYYDGSVTPDLSVAVDLEDLYGNSILDANGCAWLGFTAGTGSFASSHDILSWTLGQQCPPSPPSSAIGSCATSLARADFLGGVDLSLAGNAAVADCDVLRLTEEAEGQSGGAWHADKLHVADGFDTTFSFQVSTGINSGGDGFAFVIQDESATALGGGGGGLGYASNGPQGITRSLAVEFDTFFFAPEFPSDHVSVQTDGVNPNQSLDVNSLGHVVLASTIKDAMPHTCRIVYTPGTLDVYIDGSLTPDLTVSVDLTDINGASILDATGCAWVGFTAGTGLAACAHDILSWTFDASCLASPRPGDFDGDCDVDADDKVLFENCASGPTVPAGPGCEARDFDDDDDVDQSDHGFHQRCYSGPGVLSDENCVSG